MPVKDLIGFFESSPPAPSSSRNALATNHAKSRISSSPSPGRLIKRSPQGLPHLGRPAATSLTHHLTTQPAPNEDLHELTTDVTEESVKHLDNVTILPTTRTTTVMKQPLFSPAIYRDDAEEYQGLLLEDLHSYPPSSFTVAPTSNSDGPLSSNSTLVNQRKFLLTTNTPVPVTTIFARNSAPLYLPNLDDYLAHLDRPHFTIPQSKGKNGVTPMFPPVDHLFASGKTIEELEANSLSPSWKNRGSILGSLTSVFIGLTGSSLIASYYSLQGLFNTVQIFALILSTIVPLKGNNLEDKWRTFFLGTIPNVLAFNFASTVLESLLFLVIFMGMAAVLLYHFYRATLHYERRDSVEGLQQPEPKGENWGLVIVSFLLAVIYLPLSTLAVHVLIWSQDLWVVPNPYTNATSYPPVVPPLGPPDEFRDPLDFCWTTTMEKTQVNFAPIVIIISALVFFTLTVWFPFRLRQVIQQSVPTVDPYTELGQPRSNSDMDREYQRLLVRDRNPFSFLYRGFRRNWGTYESTYFLAKLSTLFIVAVLDSNNCLFRSFPGPRIAVVRQIVLLVSTVAFFALQCCFAPFVDPVCNAGEWISRVNYVSTAAIALAVALNVPGRNVIDGPILYTVYGITYGLSFYFIIIDTSIMQRVVKKLARRVDFSIDIFSPRLDLSYSSLHTRRRVWQESITTLLLTDPECAIPINQHMVYAQPRDCEYPPYLLKFLGTPGERHVENLKILREVGSVTYKKAVALVYGSDRARFKDLEEEIQRHFIGPDCYWMSPSAPPVPGRTRGFGNAWWCPFPPTLVIQYDDGPVAVLQEIPDFELYISQNSSQAIWRRRQIRMSLRALDGQTVRWPYQHVQPIGSYSLWCFGSRRYNADTSVFYESCVLRIKRRGQLVWEDLQLGSGFDVELVYGKDVRVDGGAIGLTDDYDLTPSLARFLMINHDRISERLGHIETTLASYRHHNRNECSTKDRVLTYRFLSCVYDLPKPPTGLTESSLEFERDLRVRNLMTSGKDALLAAYERFVAVSRSEATRWWYIFWDDLWRRNYDTINALQLHASDFSPYYPTSIAYTPLPRPALEAFLIERGILSKVGKSGDFFHTGLLNKLYMRLNETVFGGTDQAILFHIGDNSTELDMENVDIQTQAASSTMGTGGGTDYDAEIQARPTYKWEGLLSDQLRKGRRRRWFGKMGAWFGVTPLWKSEMLSKGLAVNVRIENGRYVVMGDACSKLS